MPPRNVAWFTPFNPSDGDRGRPGSGESGTGSRQPRGLPEVGKLSGIHPVSQPLKAAGPLIVAVRGPGGAASLAMNLIMIEKSAFIPSAVGAMQLSPTPRPTETARSIGIK